MRARLRLEIIEARESGHQIGNRFGDLRVGGVSETRRAVDFIRVDRSMQRLRDPVGRSCE
jgi:hypothetical protein